MRCAARECGHERAADCRSGNDFWRMAEAEGVSNKLATHRDSFAERGIATRHEEDGLSVHAYSPATIEAEHDLPPEWIVRAAGEFGFGLCRMEECQG